jgi:predicted nucleic acid-binding protein
VKLLVEESGSDVIGAAYTEAEGVRTTSVAHVEATSALARMRKGDRITATQLRAKLSQLDRLWRSLYVHAVNDAILEFASQCAVLHELRAYDAMHLAGALAFAKRESVEFACWGRELRGATAEGGTTLLPKSL